MPFFFFFFLEDCSSKISGWLQLLSVAPGLVDSLAKPLEGCTQMMPGENEPGLWALEFL